MLDYNTDDRDVRAERAQNARCHFAEEAGCSEEYEGRTLDYKFPTSFLAVASGC